MQLKLDFQLNDNELIEGLKAELRKVAAKTMEATIAKAHELKNAKLGSSGSRNWGQGFSSHKVDDDLYVIRIEGQLASWMEDGIQTGEISRAVMAGNRAQHNKADGKKYVDVPFFKDADGAGNIKGTSLNVRAFADADSLVKSVKFSDYKKKSIREEKRVVSRIKDIIKSVDPSGTKPAGYLTIRRVSENSTWPKSPFPGAKIFEDLDQFIDQKFAEFLQGME